MNTMILLSLFLSCTKEKATEKTVIDDDDDDVPMDYDVEDEYNCNQRPDPLQTPLLFYAAPYDDNGNQASTWYYGTVEGNEIIELGSLDIGRSMMSNLSFTPDGDLAFLATDDGKIQGITIDEQDVPTLLPAQELDVYASFVMVDPTGDRLWIVDENWPNNGGGIYRASISCEGELSGLTKFWESKNAHRIIAPQFSSLIITAREVDGTAGNVFIGSVLPDGNATQAPYGLPLEGAYSLFSQGDPILSAAALSHDKSQLLIGENSEFSGVENRIVWQNQESKEYVELNFLDPVDIIAHPEGAGFLLVSGYGNKVAFLNTTSMEIEEPSYQGTRPQLPGRAVEGIDTVFISENQGIRSLSFLTTGIQDNGVMTLHTQRDTNGLGAIVGGLGFRPPNPNIWPN